MTTPLAVRLRRITGWMAATLFLFALISLADALTAGFTGGPTRLQALPGAALPLTSPLPAGASTLEEMRVTGSGRGVSIRPESLFSGFWLGGTMWRGTVLVESDATPGSHLITLEGPPLSEAARKYPPISIDVTVFPNEAAMQAASPSRVTRWLGLNPFALSACLAGAGLPLAGIGFLLTRREEALLTLEGKAVVYMVKKTDDGLLVAFSLGRDQGLAPGDVVSLAGPDGTQSGLARVEECTRTDATARMFSGVCRPGYIAARSGAPA